MLTSRQGSLDCSQVKSRKYGAHHAESWKLSRAELEPIIADFRTELCNEKQTLQKLLDLESLKRIHARFNHGGQHKALEDLLLAYLKIHIPNNAFRFASTRGYLLEEEGCVIATRNIPAGEVIDNLEGWRVPLLEDEHTNLVKEEKDFSVIDRTHYCSTSQLVAPLKMLNHSCKPNAELRVMGARYHVKVIAISHINEGQELTIKYGSGYFGDKNQGCLCEPCHNGRAAEQGDVKQAVFGTGTTADYVEHGMDRRKWRACRATVLRASSNAGSKLKRKQKTLGANISGSTKHEPSSKRLRIMPGDTFKAPVPDRAHRPRLRSLSFQTVTSNKAAANTPNNDEELSHFRSVSIHNNTLPATVASPPMLIPQAFIDRLGHSEVLPRVPAVGVSKVSESDTGVIGSPISKTKTQLTRRFTPAYVASLTTANDARHQMLSAGRTIEPEMKTVLEKQVLPHVHAAVSPYVDTLTFQQRIEIAPKIDDVCFCPENSLVQVSSDIPVRASDLGKSVVLQYSPSTTTIHPC